MSYFSKFPLIKYDIKGDGNTKLVPNIFKRIRVRRGLADNVILYEKMFVQDGDTPDIMADRVYGDPTLHWILLLINNVVDPYYDWPCSDASLLEFIKKKYGVDNVTATHHWENANGLEVMSTDPGAIPITNFAYETKLNDDKRLVKILQPEFLIDFVKEFEFLLNN